MLDIAEKRVGHGLCSLVSELFTAWRGRSRMLDSNIHKLARKVHLFEGLNNRQIRMILRLSHRRTFLPGSLVLGEGFPGRRMFVVLFGEVAISRRVNEKDGVIARLGPGCTLGEMSLVDSDRRSARAVASCLTETLELDEDVLASLPAPVIITLYRNMAAIISGRLRLSNEGGRGDLTSKGQLDKALRAIRSAAFGGPFRASLAQALTLLSVPTGIRGRSGSHKFSYDGGTCKCNGGKTGVGSGDGLSSLIFRTVRQGLKGRAKAAIRTFIQRRGID